MKTKPEKRLTNKKVTLNFLVLPIELDTLTHQKGRSTNHK